jgi:hypothetical protein
MVKGDSDGFVGVTVSVKGLGAPEELTDGALDGPPEPEVPYPEAVLVTVPGWVPEPLKL